MQSPHDRRTRGKMPGPIKTWAVSMPPSASTVPFERTKYLDYMTFRANKRPLFSKIFGPLTGLKDEWPPRAPLRKNWTCPRSATGAPDRPVPYSSTAGE